MKDNLDKIASLPRFLMVIGGAFFGLILFEIFLQILPEKLTKIDYTIADDQRIYSYTREIKFKPFSERVWTGLGEPTIWHFNNLGFRERPIQIEKPKDIYRISIIGDSIVMGFGVEDYETFSRQLEKLLKPKKVDPAMRHIEVLNMGVQGYSTPQYAAVLKEEAMRIGSDLVIVGVYPSNDITGGIGFVKNDLHRRLMSIPDFMPYPVNQFLKEKSKLYLFLLTRYYTFIKRYTSDYQPNRGDDNLGWQILKKDLADMKKAADQKNTKLVFVVIPHPKEVVGEIKTDDQSKFTGIAKKLNLTYYDPFDDLSTYPNSKELYLPELDDHFSPKGNEYFATLLANFLWDNKIF